MFEQLISYLIFFALVQFKIEEITQKLRTGELGIPADPAARFVCNQHGGCPG